VNSLVSGAPDGAPGTSQNTFASVMSLTRRFSSGAVASASTSVARDGTDGLYAPFAPAYTSSLGVELQQPLLRNRATDPARTTLLITALDRDRTGAGLARQAQETVAAVERAYWTLVAARRAVEVRRQSVALAEQQRTDTEIRIEAKTLAVADLAQPVAEVERRRGDLFAAQETATRAERALKLLMLDDLTDPAWADELVPADAPTAATAVPIDLARAIEDAQRHRPEIAEWTSALSQRDLEVAQRRDELKPRLDLVVGYTVRGFAGDREPISSPLGPNTLPPSLSGGLGHSWSNLFDRKFPDAVAGVTLELPLGGREAKGQVGAAEAERRRAATSLARTRDRIAVEVMNAVTSIETTGSRIAAARAGLTAAETQLRAEQDRFAAGLSNNFFVLARQNDLALAQLAETAALTDYQKARTELARASGTLLRDRQISIQ
jgi:outer membrane protein